MSARRELAECGVPLTGAAAVRLYDDHVDAVHALIARRVGIEPSAEITAQAFEHALDRWDLFDQQHGTERLFLFASAVTVLRKHPELEHQYLSSLHVDDAPVASFVADPLVANPGDSSPRVVDHAANRDVLSREQTQTSTTLAPNPTMQAVAELDADDRDVLLLSLWESLPQSSIAEMLDTSVSSVRTTLGRVRRELKAATSGSDPKGRRRR